MATVLVLFVGTGILNIVETIYYTQNGETLFGNPLGFTWMLWGAATVILIGFYYFRKMQQKRFWKISQESFNQEEKEDKKEGTYFYQTPVAGMFDKMPIVIEGMNKMKFELYLKNLWYKFLVLFQIYPTAGGIKLVSDENTVKVVPIKLLVPKDHFDVYMNETYYGRLRSKGFLKEGGSKKYLNFIFTTEAENTFTIESHYFSMETNIRDSEEKNILTAKRTLVDLTKNEKTNRRGERHHIQASESELPEEILLSLYVQVMEVRN